MSFIETIVREQVQEQLQRYVNRDVYIHLETTNGAYASEGMSGPKMMTVCAFIRNAQVRFHRALLTGDHPYRAGLQTDLGWVYAEGLTHWEVDEHDRLLLAGHDVEGRLVIALQLSLHPFPE